VTWAPDYITLELLRRYLEIDDQSEDVFLQLWITTVSRNVDTATGRQFGKVATAEERYYEPLYDRMSGYWYAAIDDLQDLTGLVVEDDRGTVHSPASSSTSTTGYQLLPRNAAAKGRPYERIRIGASGPRELAITGLWGWNAQPAAVSTGMLLQANRLSARRKSPFGIAGSPATGSELRLLAKLDPDFETSLRPLQRKWWAC
jgi:hypothetical protein